MRNSLLAIACCFGLAAPAWAQGAQPGPGSPASRQAKPQANWSLKGHVSLQLSGGYDLDVFGGILAVGQGQRVTPDFSQGLVINTTAYPDVYVKTPRRPQASVGFGIFRRDELFVRVSRSRMQAQPLNVGVSGAGMLATLSDFNDQSIDFGLRHYLNTGKARRIYMALSAGQRKIDAISGVFTPTFAETDTPPAGARDSLGTLRLYDASKVLTAGLDFGATFEIHHIGLFFEGGARFQGKLKRIDDDLAVWGLETANDTGGRFYMPVQLGIIIRM